jgi:hypothetical protein
MLVWINGPFGVGKTATALSCTGGSGQPSKLVCPIVLSQLVGPPPARRIIGLVTVHGISHFLILRQGFSCNHLGYLVTPG